MPVFEFLGEQDEPALEKAKGYVPEGWKVRKKGEDFWRVDETETGPDDELRPPDNIPTATPDEMKSYSQRRGETSAKIFKAADQIIDKYAGDAPDSLRNKYKAAVRANPDDAAKTVEKYYEELFHVKPPSRIGEPTRPAARWRNAPYDPEFNDLENSVRAFRSMKRGPEEQALTGQLGKTDFQKNLSELQNLKGQLDTVTRELASAKDTMPEVVSGRGAEEQRKTLAAKQQKAAALAEHIEQLEKLTVPPQPQASLQPDQETPSPGLMAGWNPSPQEQTITPPAKPDLYGDIYANIKAAGKDPQQFKLALVAAAKKLEEEHGIDTETLRARVPFSRALVTALSVFNPSGLVLQALLSDTKPPSSEGLQNQTVSSAKGQGNVTAPSPEEDHLQNLRKMQAERRQLYKGLASTPELNNWFGVLVFVFLSIITRSPAIAAAILGISQRKGTLRGQLDLLEKEMHEEAGLLREQTRARRYARTEAARELERQQNQQTRTQDQQARFKHDFDMLAARAIARSHEGEKRAQNQEDKSALANMRHDLQMYQGQVRDINDQLDALGDPFKDRYGFSKDEQGKAQRDRLRQSLLNNLNIYKEKAEKLAQIIEKATGSDQLLNEAITPQGQQR